MTGRAARKLPGRPSGDDLVEDVTFLLDMRVDPEQIARQVGRHSVATLQRALQRYGEYDLAGRLKPKPRGTAYRNDEHRRERNDGADLP